MFYAVESRFESLSEISARILEWWNAEPVIVRNEMDNPLLRKLLLVEFSANLVSETRVIRLWKGRWG